MNKLPKPKPRNLTALSPLLRKSGVHMRSKSGLKREAKLALDKEVIL